MILLISKSFTAFFITLIIGWLMISLWMIVFSFNAEAFAWSLIIIPIFAFLNVVFLILLYILNISKGIILNYKILIVEIVVFYLSYSFVSKVLDKIIQKLPYDYVFDVSPTMTSKKFYFTDNYYFIYTFAVLFILVLFSRNLISKYSSIKIKEK